MSALFIEQFPASYDSPPEEIVLDFDATDDPVHAQQQRFFQGYYRHYCFLPLYVFCGGHLLCALLRPSNIDAARHSRAVTSLDGDPHSLYDDVYTQRGGMENRIKEQQLMLFADRTSCHDFAANQFRLLSSFAYVLLHQLRTVHLAETEPATAQINRIRLTLLKIAARVTLSVRRVVLHLSSSYPYQSLFRSVAGTLIPAPG